MQMSTRQRPVLLRSRANAMAANCRETGPLRTKCDFLQIRFSEMSYFIWFFPFRVRHPYLLTSAKWEGKAAALQIVTRTGRRGDIFWSFSRDVIPRRVSKSLPVSRHGECAFITFAIFTCLQVCAAPSAITTGHFAAALPFNESFHCLVDNRMSEWLSVLVAATAYPIR